MTRLLIIEHGDPDRHGIDTVLMIVPDNFDRDEALGNVDLINPLVVDYIELDDLQFAPLIDLGEYRQFIG